MYPAPDGVVAAKDSSFLFGSTGTGDARLWINGAPVRVWPNGAWLAWVALPPDSLMRFRIFARTATDSADLDYPLRRAGWTPPLGAAAVARLDFACAARARVVAGERVSDALRPRERRRQVRLRLPNGATVPLLPQPRLEEVPEGTRAFDRDTTKLAAEVRRDRYVGVIRGRRLGPDPGPVLPVPDAPAAARAPGLVAGAGVQFVMPRLPDSLSWGVVEAIRGARHGARPLAAPGLPARHAPARGRAGRRPQGRGRHRPAHRRTRRARRHLSLVLSLRHPRARERTDERRSPPSPRAGVGGVGGRRGGASGARGERGAGGRRIGAPHADARPGPDPRPAQPSRAVPGDRDRSHAGAPPLRRAGRRQLDPVRRRGLAGPSGWPGPRATARR